MRTPHGVCRGRRVLLGLTALAAACASSSRGPWQPTPLHGGARQLARDILAASPSPHQAGDVTVADGTRVPYDRYCLIGSELGGDRTRAFHAFVDDLRRLGGDFAMLEQDRAGRASKVLFVVDGERIVATFLRW